MISVSVGRMFLILCVLSGLHTTGLTLHRDPPIPSGTVSPFLEPIKYNTTVFVGQTAYLPCVVKHLGDKTVSWIRKRDLHILSSGQHIYTSDKRFSLIREGKLRHAWTLKILSVQKKDEGTYECQVNTEPKITVSLHLIVLGSPDEDTSGALALGMLDSPTNHQRDDHRAKGSGTYEAKILGPSLVQLEEGQLANFTCIISHARTPPNVTWFVNDIPIAHRTRGGFNIETEKSTFTSISQLVIFRVDKQDEGKYSCGGFNIYPNSVSLKIHPSHHHSSDPRWSEVSSAPSSGSSLHTKSVSCWKFQEVISETLMSYFHKFQIKSNFFHSAYSKFSFSVLKFTLQPNIPIFLAISFSSFMNFDPILLIR